MAEDPGGPFGLPDRWVHAVAPPAWSDLATSAVAFLGWRLDRWASLERLHALDEAVRRIDGDALALGLHNQQATGRPGRGRVRDVLLARGVWAPTGLADELPDTGEQAGPGTAWIVDGGELVASFDPTVPVEKILARLEELAGEGEPSWRPRGDAGGPWPLAFPYDVDVAGSQLAIADTGHNRVLVAGPGGQITRTVGEGVPDEADGPAEAAHLQAPRGVCWVGETLFVADTGNDAIRKVDLVHEDVSTLVECEPGTLPAGACCLEDGSVLFAMAGTGAIARWEDGDLEPDAFGGSVELVHPVDLAVEDDRVLVADPGIPGVHLLGADGSVHAAWREGLAEPSGVLWGPEGTPLAADAGTGMIHRLPLEAEPRPLWEERTGIDAPAGLGLEAGQLVVADGGGHHLWHVDPQAGASPTRVRLTERPLALAEHIHLDPIEMAPGSRLDLSVAYLLAGETDPGSIPAGIQTPTVHGPLRDLSVSQGPAVEEGRIRAQLQGEVAASGELRVRWSLTEGALGHEAVWDLPIIVRPGAERTLRLALSTSPP